MTPDPPPAYRGEAVRRFRDREGWTLGELARWLGVTKGHLSRIERGLAPVSPMLRRILADHGVKPTRES